MPRRKKIDLTTNKIIHKNRKDAILEAKNIAKKIKDKIKKTEEEYNVYMESLEGTNIAPPFLFFYLGGVWRDWVTFCDILELRVYENIASKAINEAAREYCDGVDTYLNEIEARLDMEGEINVNYILFNWGKMKSAFDYILRIVGIEEDEDK